MIGPPLRLCLLLYLQSWRIFRRGWISAFFALLAPVAIAVMFGLMAGNATAPSWRLDIAVVVDAAGRQDGPWSDLDRLSTVSTVFATRSDATERLRRGLVAGMLEYIHDAPSDTWRILATAPSQWHAVLEDMHRAASAECQGACADFRIQEPSNESSTSLSWIAAGVIVMALGNLAFFVVAQNTAMARQDGSLLMYSITPISARLYFTAEVSFMALVALGQAVVILLALIVASDFAIAGSWLAIGGVVFLNALAFLGLSLFLSGALPTPAVVFAVAPFLNVLFLGLGNLFWPAISVDWLRPIVLALPARYAVDALRQVLSSENGLFPLWLDLAVLLGVLALSFLCAGRWFRFDAGGR